MTTLVAASVRTHAPYRRDPASSHGSKPSDVPNSSRCDCYSVLEWTVNPKVKHCPVIPSITFGTEWIE